MKLGAQVNRQKVLAIEILLRGTEFLDAETGG
jgi:hypothetical protein